MTRTERMAQLTNQWHSQLTYLNMKVEQADWHGVQDAASDLRDIEERMKGIQEVFKENE